MFRTVVGIFDKVQDADNAIERLMKSGFDRGLIDVFYTDHAGSGHSGERPGITNEGTDTDRIKTFFEALFETEEETYLYCAVGQKSAAIVSVQAEKQNEVERIASLLDECGAIDVNERAKVMGLKELPGPTSIEKDDFSGSDEVATQLAADDPIGETPVPVERPDEGVRTAAGMGTRSRIVDHPVGEEERLREERVFVRKSSRSGLPTEKNISASS